MNRRNVIVGLGAIVAGGGAALGTGAFSSVEAERSVSISTEGDGAALLQLEINEDIAGISDDGEDDVIGFEFEEINRDATTTFDGALTVANAGSENVEFSVSEISEDDSDRITFEYGDDDLSDDNTVTLDANGTLDSEEAEDIDIVLNLEGETDDEYDEIEVTFLAEQE